MSSKNGFTFIEIIIAIFILSVAVVGIFNAFSIMVILTSDAADQLTATYLAQEGMEIVRNIRDTNWLKADDNPGSGFTWLSSGIDNCSTGCEADYKSNELSSYGGKELKIDANGFYVYDETDPSEGKFKRKITITQLTEDAVKVVTQVSWKKKSTILFPGQRADTCSKSNCITVEGTLYNWH